ncbi:Ribonuclease H, partial [Parasponia andersonii]
MLILNELDIIVEKPKAIKSQALTELLKHTQHNIDKEILSVETEEEHWVLYFDGTSTHNEGSVGIVLTNSQGETFKKAVKLAFSYSNNEAEYEALAI